MEEEEPIENNKSAYKPRKWYNQHEFSLIPLFRYEKAKPHNTAKFTFCWLFFSAWSLDHFSFELSFVCNTHWGIGVIGILPYLRWTASIPVSRKYSMLIDKYLSRKPTPVIIEHYD